MLKTRINSDSFDFLAEISSDIIEIIDIDLTRIYVNSSVTRYTGIPNDIFNGRNILEKSLFPEIAERYSALVKQAVNQKSPSGMEVLINTVEGLTYFKIDAVPRVVQNAPEKIFVIYRNITEIKQKDLALTKINRKFTTAAEALLQPFVILLPLFQNDEIIDFVYDYINEEGCKTNGIPKEATIGRRLLELFPLHKELGTFAAFREVFITGIPYKEIIKYDGPAGAGTLNGHFNMSCAKFQDGLVVTWQDITNTVNAQNEVQKSEQRLYSAFNSNPVAMVLTNSQGNIIGVNKRFRQLLGFTKKETAGKNIRDLNLVTKNAALDLIEQAIVLKEVISRYDLEIKDKNGNILQILFSSVPVESVNSLNFLFTLVDMTKQKELERSLLQSLEEKDILLKEIHHRVKNNLQIISSLLNLQSSVTESNEAQNIISETKNRVQSIALMHENLYRNKSLSAIKLDDYVSEMVNRIHQAYCTPEKVVTWKVDIKDINVDLKQGLSIGLILNELVTNCYKYAFIEKNRGEIIISAVQADKNILEISISDNGKGLPEGVDLTQPATLGLQLVTILTSQLDGKLTYRNREGAEFKIKFPLNS